MEWVRVCKQLKAEMEELIQDFGATPEADVHCLKEKWQNTAAVRPSTIIANTAK